MKLLLAISEELKGSSSTIVPSTLSIVTPSLGISRASSSALITLIAILITKEEISKLKIRYTKLRQWINVISLLYQKTSKQSMIHKKNMKIQFKLEYVFGDILGKESISSEHIRKLITFLAKMM